MNESKFERFILSYTNNDVPFSWDLLDETGGQVVEQMSKMRIRVHQRSGHSMDGTNFQVGSRLNVLCKGRLIQIMRKNNLNNDML